MPALAKELKKRYIQDVQFFFIQNFRIDSWAQYDLNNLSSFAGKYIQNKQEKCITLKRSTREKYLSDNVYFSLLGATPCTMLGINLKTIHYKMWTFWKCHLFHNLLRRRFRVYYAEKILVTIDP